VFFNQDIPSQCGETEADKFQCYDQVELSDKKIIDDVKQKDKYQDRKGSENEKSLTISFVIRRKPKVFL
jgi:hypothetical protein